MVEHKSDALSYNDRAYVALYDTAVLIRAIKTCCQAREFVGEYYGMPQDYTKMISDERNEYLSLLSMASDKLYNLKHFNLCIERELSLSEKNTDYCGR